jgi:N-acetylglucosaminyldiphosphoundecaprenol N-acetyl-beta-D-mannosaminyltransferase
MTVRVVTDPVRQVECLGLRLDALTMQQAIDRCIGWCKDPSTTRVVFPINASIVVAMRRDPNLKAAFDAADMRPADGASLLWAARLEGEHLPERVAGIDLMDGLVARAAEEGLSVYFLGARPEVVAKLVDVYRARYPKLRIAGFHDGYFDRAGEHNLAQSIRASGAHLLFIGMPTPFKEVWAEKVRNQLGVRVVLGVGGSFDVIAGFIPRAPLWMQRNGLEWSWRLLREPGRLWRRYLFTNTLFIALTLRSAARRLRRTRA